MIKTKTLFVIMALFAIFSTGAEAKLYKWVDDNGETHYGEVIPPEYADKNRVLIDKGQEVKKPEKSTDSTAKGAAEDTAEAEQKRRDQALMGTFSSESEIDLARDRNLQQLDARTNSIQLRLKTAQDDLDGYQKEKDAMVKAGKLVNNVLQEEIDQAAARASRLQDELVKSQADAAAMRARYNADKKRYHELTSGGK